MQNFRITAQSDRRNCRDNAGCIFTGAVHRTMAVSAVGESAERNRFAERESAAIWISLAAASTTGILSGLYPAFYSTSFNPALAIQGNFGNTRTGKRLRTVLIATQFMVTIGFIAAALLIHRQDRFLKSHDLGFRQQNILITTVSSKTSEQLDAYAGMLKSHPAIADVTFSFGQLVDRTLRCGFRPFTKIEQANSASIA